jgi:hypothetical protein
MSRSGTGLLACAERAKYQLQTSSSPFDVFSDSPVEMLLGPFCGLESMM